MAIGQYKDVEKIGEIDISHNLEEPFIRHGTVVGSESAGEGSDVGADDKGSVWMVLLCTFVAVCGSFEFGSCVSIIQVFL